MCSAYVTVVVSLAGRRHVLARDVARRCRRAIGRDSPATGRRTIGSPEPSEKSAFLATSALAASAAADRRSL